MASKDQNSDNGACLEEDVSGAEQRLAEEEALGDGAGRHAQLVGL